jgi:hypothetical protein
VVTFSSVFGDVFQTDKNQQGTWSGGGATLSMTWSGSFLGTSFSGHWVISPPEYKGTLDLIGPLYKAKVVRGANPGC